MLDKKSVTQLEVMSLAGSLNFACSVVCPGRPFVRRLYDLAMTAQHKYQHLKVSKALREDLRLWQSFLTDFNGKALFPDKRKPLVRLNMDILGVIDFDKGEAFVLATLFDSQLVQPLATKLD